MKSVVKNPLVTSLLPNGLLLQLPVVCIDDGDFPFIFRDAGRLEENAMQIGNGKDSPCLSHRVTLNLKNNSKNHSDCIQVRSSRNEPPNQIKLKKLVSHYGFRAISNDLVAVISGYKSFALILLPLFLALENYFFQVIHFFIESEVYKIWLFLYFISIFCLYLTSV